MYMHTHTHITHIHAYTNTHTYKNQYKKKVKEHGRHHRSPEPLREEGPQAGLKLSLRLLFSIFKNEYSFYLPKILEVTLHKRHLSLQLIKPKGKATLNTYTLRVSSYIKH